MRDHRHQPVPVAAERGEAIAAHHQAQVRHAVLDQLQSGIAASEQRQLDVAGQGTPLHVRQAQVELQADGHRAAAPPPAAQLVLAGGEESRGRAFVAAVGQDPHAGAVGRQGPHRDAAADPDPMALGLGQQQRVEPAARHAPSGERQAGGGHGRPGHDPHRLDRHRTQPGRRQFECRQLPGGLAAQELAADLVMRAGLALEQHDAPAGLGQPDRCRRPAQPSAGHGDVPAHAAPSVRKRIASAVRPGPNARAAPDRAGPPCASIRAKTNITVAELILP